MRNIIIALLTTGAVFASCHSLTKEVQLTDSLDNDVWNQSQWISVVDAPVITDSVFDGTRAADGANWFVSVQVNEQKVKEAKWMTTGLGVYDLYVNGELVGKEVLKPGFTHYAKTRRSFTYDITPLFNTQKQAENVLSAEVTPGWWADKIITPAGQVGMNGKKCAFRGVLQLTYTDGSTQYFGTDTVHWKAGIAGPVLHADIFDGEVYDARVKPGYETPEKLSKPELNKEFEGEILPTCGAEIYHRTDLALAPIRLYIYEGIEEANPEQYGKVKILREYSDGDTIQLQKGQHLVADFGQNCAAVPSFLFQSNEGTELTCEVGELLNDGMGDIERGMDGAEGSVHRTNLRIPETGMKLSYTFAQSEQPVNYCPRFTFFGYRFISVTVTDDVTLYCLRSIPVTSITEEMEIGHLSTGNESINKLIANTIWGQRSNYLSVPTDCPQRNERLGWTADTQVFTETGTFFAHTNAFFHKWLRDMRDTQGEWGGYPGVAPLGQYGAEPESMMRVGWADAGVIVPWTVWKQFGDTSIIDESWESMNRFMQHMTETKYDHQTLLKENGNFQWADWLSYEPLETCTGKAWNREGLLPDAVVYWNYLSASYWHMDACMMRDMAAATHRDTQPYEDMMAESKQYLQEHFLNDDGTFQTAILNTMQTPALFALKNHLVEGAALENMKSRLRQNFYDHDNCLQTGFLGTSILLTTLTEFGMSDVAYNLLFQRKNPSWLYSIDNGATTIWERWNSYTIEDGMGPKGMNSFNHYAYGVVCQWIWECSAGIAADPACAGFKHIKLAPIPDKRLGHIEASYQSAAGLIKSAWRYEGAEWVWEFTIPEGATASVTLPGEKESKEYQSGSYTLRKAL